jgi:hypothetical protein
MTKIIFFFNRDQKGVAGRRPGVAAGGVQAGFALDASKLNWPWTRLKFILHKVQHF